MKKLISGLALAMASLWVTPYVMAHMPADSWAAFPSMFTGMLAALAGIIIFSSGVSDVMEL